MSTPVLDRRALVSLGRALRSVRALPARRIGAHLRELIILHVSSINGCPVCSATHELVGRTGGVGPEDVEAARRCEPTDERFDERTRVALQYAGLRTKGATRDDPDVVARFEALFDAQEQREVQAIVDLFTFNNRFNNTWERLVPGARRRRDRMGLCG
jgi:AhpD family alkylhydroperoxidase